MRKFSGSLAGVKLGWGALVIGMLLAVVTPLFAADRATRSGIVVTLSDSVPADISRARLREAIILYTRDLSSTPPVVEDDVADAALKSRALDLARERHARWALYGRWSGRQFSMFLMDASDESDVSTTTLDGSDSLDAASYRLLGLKIRGLITNAEVARPAPSVPPPPPVPERKQNLPPPPPPPAEPPIRVSVEGLAQVEWHETRTGFLTGAGAGVSRDRWRLRGSGLFDVASLSEDAGAELRGHRLAIDAEYMAVRPEPLGVLLSLGAGARAVTTQVTLPQGQDERTSDWLGFGAVRVAGVLQLSSHFDARLSAHMYASPSRVRTLVENVERAATRHFEPAMSVSVTAFF